MLQSSPQSLLNQIDRRRLTHKDLNTLQLGHHDRQLIFQTSLREHKNKGEIIYLFLFDHALLLAKQVQKGGLYDLYRSPIPLDLLLIPPEVQEQQQQDPKAGAPITFIHRGRHGFRVTFAANDATERTSVIDKITEQQAITWQKHAIFKPVVFASAFFSGKLKGECATTYDRGRTVFIAAEDGIYRHQVESKTRPVKVLPVEGATFIDVAEEQRLLFVLSDHCLTAYPLDAIESIAGQKRGETVSNSVTFFQIGYSMGRFVVCVVKVRAIASFIKLLELVPPDQAPDVGKAESNASAPQGAIQFRTLKKFEHPMDVTWVRLGSTKLCAGCARGISLVDLETLETQDVLDPLYQNPLTMLPDGDKPRPMAMFRIDDEYFICYDSIAFYVNSSGSRPRNPIVIYWEGHPTSFSLRAPYIFAFSPSFIEIRHIGSGELVQTIHGHNIKCLTLPSDLRGTASIGDAAPPPYYQTSEEWDDPLLIHSNDGAMLLQRVQQS